jgi:hypothetical protein
VVSNGFYPGGVTVAKPLTLAGVHRAQYTMIDGGGTNRCLSIAEGVKYGFTLTNGWAQNGGGLWCDSTNGWVTNCIIAGNSAAQNGGGAYGAARQLHAHWQPATNGLVGAATAASFITARSLAIQRIRRRSFCGAGYNSFCILITLQQHELSRRQSPVLLHNSGPSQYMAISPLRPCSRLGLNNLGSTQLTLHNAEQCLSRARRTLWQPADLRRCHRYGRPRIHNSR